MTERKDADIIRAAQGCKKGNCFACDYDEYTDCKKALIADLAGVIDHRDKRIEELEERIDIMTEGGTRMTEQEKDVKEVQAEIEGDGRSSWWYVCSECHGAIDPGEHKCRHCGNIIMWN